MGVVRGLLDKVDSLILGGGIANTFLAAAGFSVGASLFEKDFIPEAQRVLDLAREKDLQLPLPLDVIVAEEIGEQVASTTKDVRDVGGHDKILDVGPKTIALYLSVVQQAKNHCLEWSLRGLRIYSFFLKERGK